MHAPKELVLRQTVTIVRIVDGAPLRLTGKGLVGVRRALIQNLTQAQARSSVKVIRLYRTDADMSLPRHLPRPTSKDAYKNLV